MEAYDKPPNRLSGFEQVLTELTTTYYLLDCVNNNVIIYDEHWMYQYFKIASFPGSFALKFIDDNFYISSNGYFYKTNHNLSLIKPYSEPGKKFRGLFYDVNSALIYVSVQHAKEKIRVFDKNLTLLNNLTFGSNPLFDIKKFNNFFYLTDYNHPLIRISLSAYCSISSHFNSIYFDQYGYMILTCGTTQKAILFSFNLTFMNVVMNTSYVPYLSIMDSKGRLISTSNQGLKINY